MAGNERTGKKSVGPKGELFDLKRKTPCSSIIHEKFRSGPFTVEVELKKIIDFTGIKNIYYRRY